MSFLVLQALEKTFPDGTRAVKGINLSIKQGEFIVLLGPSGCGKTTTLRMIAGLERPSGGRVLLDAQDVTHLRPAQRDVGFVFQFYALYPHLSVRENILFPLKAVGIGAAEQEEILGHVSGRLGLTGLLSRYPRQLSGGDRQRVALARAMVRRPRVYLMDEPLGTLDADLRLEMREFIRGQQLEMNVTTIYVTHDQEEAMSLAEHVIVMEEGRIMQRGTPEEVYSTPANKFVAEFIGRSNWFGGVLGTAESNGLHMFGPEDAASFRVPSPGAQDGAGYEVCVRPERILLSKAQPTNDRAVNCLPVKVVDVAYLGADLHMFVETEQGKRISAIEKNAGGVGHREGEAVFACFRPEDCILVPVARRAGEE